VGTSLDLVISLTPGGIRRRGPTMMTRIVFALVLTLASGAAAQDADAPADAMIRLERTSCFGACPAYTVTIDANGLVTYDGEKFVRVTGRRTARISRSATAKLLASARRIQFFELQDSYTALVTDLPTTYVTVTVNGRTKRITDYVGAPEALTQFEREIDATANTRRWVFLDAEALEDLSTAGWSATGDEGATWLRQAIDQDDVEIAKRLIALGADLNGPPEYRSAEYRLPPLIGARSRAMVDLLVEAGADPNQRTVGATAAQTPLMTTGYKNAEVAEALLKAGARVDDLDDGRSALWQAACRGNWRVVTVLLRAGAKPAGGTGMTALECTRQAQMDLARIPRTVLDRGGPTTEDFDRVIALLESATRKSPH
jgi:hypothetical protein